MMSMHTGAACKNLGGCLVTLSRFEEAAVFQAWTAEIYMKLLGMHIETARAIFEYGQTLSAMEQWAPASDCLLVALHMVCAGVARDEHVKKVVKTLIETDACFFHVSSSFARDSVADVTPPCSCCVRPAVFKMHFRTTRVLSPWLYSTRTSCSLIWGCSSVRGQKSTAAATCPPARSTASAALWPCTAPPPLTCAETQSRCATWTCGCAWPACPSASTASLTRSRRRRRESKRGAAVLSRCRQACTTCPPPALPSVRYAAARQDFLCV
jgi:hypothetical protein